MENRELYRADRGILLQLQPFSVHDGEGIRTTLFLPGCPLRCQWCSNPESWVPAPQLAFYGGKCTNCGACARACPQGLFPAKNANPRSACTACGACTAACPSGALHILCEEISAEEIVRKVERDDIFFRHSGGGVTFSGGEPTVQEGFLRTLSEAFYQRGIPMWMETCGYFDWHAVKDILHRLEHVFCDIKCMDEEQHRRFTGVSNRRILQNLIHMAEEHIPVTVRVPLVKEVNCDRENLEATIAFLKEHLPGAEAELLCYHDLGREKYPALGLDEHLHLFSAPEPELLAHIKDLFSSQGVRLTEYR